MEQMESAYHAGVAKAQRDIAKGSPQFVYAAQAAWGDDLASALQSRFGVRLVPASCLTDAESSSFESGYNATIQAHIDSIHGMGSMAAVLAEILLRRKALYQAWLAAQPEAPAVLFANPSLHESDGGEPRFTQGDKRPG